MNAADPMSFRKGISVELAGKNFEKYGAPKNKINVGVALYGRGFKIANPSETPKPFVSASGGLTVGTFETNNFDYYDIVKNYQTSSNLFWDASARAPFIFDKNGNYITFDNA
jgi:chitinase